MVAAGQNVDLSALSQTIAAETSQPHATVHRLAAQHVQSLGAALETGKSISLASLGKFPPGDDPGSYEEKPGTIRKVRVVALKPDRWPPNDDGGSYRSGHSSARLGDDPGSFEVNPHTIGRLLFAAVAKRVIAGDTVHLAGLGTFHVPAPGAVPRFAPDSDATLAG